MQAKSKLFGLAALCLGYMAITACGGGGGGEGGGGQAQAQAECYPVPSKCRDGTDAVKNDGSGSWGVADPVASGVRSAAPPNGDKASCAYVCGALNIRTSSTVTDTATTTTTTTQTNTVN